MSKPSDTHRSFTGKSRPSDLEADFRVHQERYRVFIEEVADGFYEVDLRGNFTFFNDALCRIFGRSASEIRGRNYRDFMDESNAQYVFGKFNEIFRTGRGLTDLIWEIVRRDGSTRALEVSAGLIRDDEGERIGFRGIARDVTEKRLAAEALRVSEQRAKDEASASRRSEKRYRLLLDFLPDPVVVFNTDSTVSYLNPAFVEVFGWNLDELEGRVIPFVPESLKEETRREIRRLYREKVIHGFETQRLTQSGRTRDIVLGGAIFYDEEGRPSGQVVVLRDVTSEKRVARTNQALSRISMALPRHRRLDERLEIIIQEVKDLLGVEGASVILLDEKRNEFYFPVASYDDSETGRKMREIRFPADKGVAGHVIKTGQPIIVPDYPRSPFAYLRVDEQSEYETRNMADVPIRTEERIVGVLCAVNKKDGAFDQADVDVLSTVAGTVAFPIENARIDEELKRSYDEVQSLNRAKDRVIHHLSHELKTPLSVLSASLELLARKRSQEEDPAWFRTLERAQRNLSRILEIQYEIEDIMRDRDYRVQAMLSTLLDVCADEMEALAAAETGEGSLVERIRRRIEEAFGRIEAIRHRVRLERFVEETLETIRPKFSHRGVELVLRLAPTPPILMPLDPLTKIVEGLVRNAVENTPDEGRIQVTVRPEPGTAVLEVRDNGVGITPEDQALVFKGVFTTRETDQYSSRRPYDFNAGGKGLDLFRMKIFSERYGFKIRLESKQCRFIPGRHDVCPGEIQRCGQCRSREECLDSGGTVVTVEFPVTEDADSGGGFPSRPALEGSTTEVRSKDG